MLENLSPQKYELIHSNHQLVFDIHYSKTPN